MHTHESYIAPTARLLKEGTRWLSSNPRRAGEIGSIMSVMEADTLWSAAAISPKPFGVLYG